jgi:hypothetical protein
LPYLGLVMPFTIACPNCGTPLTAPDAVRGQKVKCKKCDEKFRAIPADGETEPAQPAGAGARSGRHADEATRKPDRSRRPTDDEDDDEAPRGKPGRRPADDEGDDDAPARRRSREEDDAEDEPSEGKRKRKRRRRSPVSIAVVGLVGAVVVVGGAIGIYLATSSSGDKPHEAPVDKGPAPVTESKMGDPAGGPGAPSGVEHVDAAGKYRVRFPSQPTTQDQTITIDNMPQTVPVTRLQNGTEEFVAYSVPLPEGTAEGEEALNAAVQRAPARWPGAGVLGTRVITHAGVKGKEVILTLPGGALAGVVRVFVTKGRTYTLAAVGPGFQSDTPAVTRFFGSLKFE